MGRAMSGNATHHIERTNALDDIADAECSGYVDIRNVKTEVKHRMTPVPKGAEAMMGTIQ